MTQTKKKPAKMGRPPLPPKKKRGHFVNVRMTAAEYAAIKAEARRAGSSFSDVLMRPWRTREDE